MPDRALVHYYIDRLMQLILEGKVTTHDIITHTLPLSEAPNAYRIFNEKEDGCVKVVLKS